MKPICFVFLALLAFAADAGAQAHNPSTPLGQAAVFDYSQAGPGLKPDPTKQFV